MSVSNNGGFTELPPLPPIPLPEPLALVLVLLEPPVPCVPVVFVPPGSELHAAHPKVTTEKNAIDHKDFVDMKEASFDFARCIKVPRRIR